MLLVWNLGSLALVICLVVPLLGFAVRRQWRLAARRREEIRRLRIRASEEAARAELEASFEYNSISVSNGYYCPVCYVPASTRCARCKAVRYCSGKCQIIHWRQGHKDECLPAPVMYNTGNEKTDVGLEVRKKTNGNLLAKADLQYAESAATMIKESALSNATCSLEAKTGDIADTKDDRLIDKEEAVSVAETSGSSFSGFSSSLSNDSSDDISACESCSTSDSERPESHLDADIAVESVETCFNIDHVVPLEPLSPKFTHLVESVDNLANMAKLNQSKRRDNVEDNQSQSLHSNVMDRPGSTDQSRTMSSGFWGRDLESKECPSDPCDVFASSKSLGADEESLSHTGSSMQFYSSSSREASSDLHDVCDVRRSFTDEAPLTAMETDKAVDEKKLLEKSSMKATSDPSDCSYASSHAVKTSLTPISSATPAYFVREVPTSTCPLDNTVVSSVALVKLKSASKANHNTFGTLKAGEVAHFSSKAANTSKISDVVEFSRVAAKSGRVTDSQKQNAPTLKVTSSLHERNGLKASVLKVVDQWSRPKSSNQYKLLYGNEITRKHNHKELFPYESFVKLYNWSKLELQPCGLINCGNSCFANVVFQCLMFTPSLTAYFLQGLHSQTCSNKEQCFTCGFENLVLKAKEGRTPLYPSGVLAQLQNIGICLGNGKEEDAHEFLRFVVETMQSVCIKESEYATLETAKLEETTLIGLTFGGYLRSKIKCMKCQGKSERHERMMDLTVEIDGDVSSLDDALRRFTRTEILDGDNKYKCGRCKSYERAKKKLKILEPPNVLTIALKRFQSGKFGKLNKLIRFPEKLDLAPYVSGSNDKSHVYRLYGVIVHLDIMNAAFSGHYVCYIKNSQNKWYKADDSTVVTSELERVLTKGAYMLFYARCSPRPPRSVCTKSLSSNKDRNVPVPKMNEKSTIPLSWSASAPSAIQCTKSPDGGTNSLQSFYSKFHRLQRILEEDSSSDSSSLFDSNSDECSCSTDSARDSASMEDFADFIFGDLRQGNRQSPYSAISPPSSSSSSASSPLLTRLSPLAKSESCSSEFPESTRRHSLKKTKDSAKQHVFEDKYSKEGRGSSNFLHSDSTKSSRTVI